MVQFQISESGDIVRRRYSKASRAVFLLYDVREKETF